MAINNCNELFYSNGCCINNERICNFFGLQLKHTHKSIKLQKYIATTFGNECQEMKLSVEYLYEKKL